MTYASIRTTAEIACDHHAAACLMERYTAASSWRGLKRSTAYDASCTPSDRCTLSRKASRRFFGIVAKCACTSANIRINSGDGSGKFGSALVCNATPSQLRGHVTDEKVPREPINCWESDLSYVAISHAAAPAQTIAGGLA